MPKCFEKKNAALPPKSDPLSRPSAPAVEMPPKPTTWARTASRVGRGAPASAAVASWLASPAKAERPSRARLNTRRERGDRTIDQTRENTSPPSRAEKHARGTAQMAQDDGAITIPSPSRSDPIGPQPDRLRVTRERRSRGQ